MFCGLVRKARLNWIPRASPCDAWSCEMCPRRIRPPREWTIPALIMIPRARPCCLMFARIDGPRGRKFANISFFFFSIRVRGRHAVTVREHDLCIRVKSRVATSGKRNWSRYAPCEKATEINGHVRACEGGKSPVRPRDKWASSYIATGKTAISSTKMKSLQDLIIKSTLKTAKKIFASKRLFWKIFY